MLTARLWLIKKFLPQMDADKRGFMSEEIRKHPLSAKGKYYVDCDSCIDHCCYDIAPSNFRLDEVLYTTYVFKQPETPEEERLCEEVVLYCPIEAVHDDGEE